MVAVDAMQAQAQLLRAELEGKQRHMISVQAELAKSRRQGPAVAKAIQDRVRNQRSLAMHSARRSSPAARVRASSLLIAAAPRIAACAQVDSALERTEDAALRRAAPQLRTVVHESCVAALEQVSARQPSLRRHSSCVLLATKLGARALPNRNESARDGMFVWHRAARTGRNARQARAGGTVS